MRAPAACSLLLLPCHDNQLKLHKILMGFFFFFPWKEISEKEKEKEKEKVKGKKKKREHRDRYTWDYTPIIVSFLNLCDLDLVVAVLLLIPL